MHLPFLVWSIGIKSTFGFFIKNCLWAGMGSTRYLNLIPKIQNLFGGRLPVFCCGGKFFFESFTFDLRFFPIHRSKKYRINCSSDSFLNPAFQLGLWHSRNHLAVKKWFRDSAAGPILPDLAGFFNYHDGPALLSFLVSALPVILNRLPRVSWPWFYLPWCVYNIPHKKGGVYWQSRYTYDVLFVYLLHWKNRRFGAIIKMLECMRAPLKTGRCFFLPASVKKRHCF